MARIRATFRTSFFGAVVGTLNFVLSRRPVAQKKALLLGFLHVESSFHEACTGGVYRPRAPTRKKLFSQTSFFVFLCNTPNSLRGRRRRTGRIPWLHGRPVALIKAKELLFLRTQPAL